MTPHWYGRFRYIPITRWPNLNWPTGARVALCANPNIEFFALDDVMPSNRNDRVKRAAAHVPNVRNWAVPDYGNRVSVLRLFQVLLRYGIRAGAAPNSQVCAHHPEIIKEATQLGWEWLGRIKPMRCG